MIDATNTLGSLAQAPMPSAAMGRDPSAFADALSVAANQGKNAAIKGVSAEPGSERARVRIEARKLVAEAFIAPMLAKIRSDNKAAAPFGPTQAEKRFGPMIDSAIADSMTRPDRFPLVKAIERSVMGKLSAQGGGA